MRTFTAPTMDALHTDLCQAIIAAPESELDVVSNVDAAIHNVVAVADSMEFDFNLKTIWLGKARWSMMVRQYLESADVIAWMNQAVNGVGAKGRGQAVLRTKVVKPRGGAATGHTNMQTRKWGSCMLSLSYRAKPKPTITLHSRTSYLGYLSALDFNIAHVLARYIAPQLGLKVEDFQFVWMVESMQWHGFKSLPWAICNDDEDIKKYYRKLLFTKLDNLEPDYAEMAVTPALRVTRRWVNYVRREDQAGKTLGDTSYNTYRRVRRRWHTEVLGYEKAKAFEGASYYDDGTEREFFKAYAPLPTVWTSWLDLSPIRLSLDASNVQLPGELADDIDTCFACGELDYDG